MNEPRWYRVCDESGDLPIPYNDEKTANAAALYWNTRCGFDKYRAVQLVDATELESAYEQGWREAAEWANADDLVCDIGSPAYLKDRARRIGR